MNKKPVRVRTVKEAIKIMRKEFPAGYCSVRVEATCNRDGKTKTEWMIYVPVDILPSSSGKGWTGAYNSFEEAFKEIKERRK